MMAKAIISVFCILLVIAKQGRSQQGDGMEEASESSMVNSTDSNGQDPATTDSNGQDPATTTHTGMMYEIYRAS